jgi:hypothetical protein
MSINYAGLHLVAEDYVTRPLSQQTYTNKMADVIHGAEAYIVPRKVDNTYRNMFEDLCKSPQIQHIRTVLHNSRATFGESGDDNESGPPEAEPPPPPTGGKLKTAVKQPRGAATEAKGAKSAVRFEVEEAIREAKLLSSEKKAKKAATPFSQKSHSSFVTARSGGSDGTKTPASAKSKSSEKSSSKKAEKQAATPRALETAFEGVAPTPKLKGIPKAKGLNMKFAEAKAAPAPAPEAKAAEVKAAPPSAEKAETSKAAKINAFVSQTAGANRIVTIVQATGRGGKGSRPAYVGHDGVPISYLDSQVSIIQLNKMIDAFNRVKAKIPDADKAAKRDVSSYISRIKAEITKRG